jgi:hypothetical protein
MPHPIVPILDSLRAFVDSRPGFDPRNYADARSYRADTSRAQRDRRDAHALLGAVYRAMTGTDDNGRDRLLCCLREGLRGRLELRDDGSIRYHEGQYYPTEYRAAACRALATTLWQYWWAPGATGDSLRRTARNVLGARLARRWFT